MQARCCESRDKIKQNHAQQDGGDKAGIDFTAIP